MVNKIIKFASGRIKRLKKRMKNQLRWKTYSPPYGICNDDIKYPILVVAPHADDELLSSYSLLSRNPQESIVFYCGLIGSSTDAKTKYVRLNEFEDFCNSLSIRYVVSNGNRIEELKGIIREKNINTVIFPSYIDWHDEHRLISKEVSQIEAPTVDLIWYSVTVPIEHKRAILGAMSEEEQNRKYQLFKKFYVSQQHLPAYRFKLQERVNANNTDNYSAEVFMPVDKDILKRAFKIPDEELSTLLGGIQDIELIRKMSFDIYSTYLS